MLGSALRAEFPVSQSNLRLLYSITHQKVLPIWKLVELKMLDFSDRTRTGISILTSVSDWLCYYIIILGGMLKVY